LRGDQARSHATDHPRSLRALGIILRAPVFIPRPLRASALERIAPGVRVQFAPVAARRASLRTIAVHVAVAAPQFASIVPSPHRALAYQRE